MTKNTQHARLCHRIVGRIGPFSTAGHGARPATLEKGPCTGPATPSSSSQPNSANGPMSKPLRASRRLGAAGRAASPRGQRLVRIPRAVKLLRLGARPVRAAPGECRTCLLACPRVQCAAPSPAVHASGVGGGPGMRVKAW